MRISGRMAALAAQKDYWGKLRVTFEKGCLAFKGFHLI
jgi:hypothetical protein